MDGFDHHYGVVHHNRDGKHQSGKGNQVDGESDKINTEECTYQRHRYRYGRDNRRTQVLQEDIHNQEHKDERFNQRLEHFVDRSEKEVVDVH